MQIDTEGHLLVTPREVQWAVLAGSVRLAHFINNVWLVGTPRAFDSYAAYSELLTFLADRLHVHPKNIVVRGSTKLGFSIAPDAEEVWREMGPESDLDVAIVDADYYHYFERELRAHDRQQGNNLFQGRRRAQALGREKSRKYSAYRYLDLPTEIGCVREHLIHLAEAPVEKCCKCVRPLTAFLFRDWWSVYARCKYELDQLRKALKDPAFPRGEDYPRRAKLAADHAKGGGPGTAAKDTGFSAGVFD